MVLLCKQLSYVLYKREIIRKYESDFSPKHIKQERRLAGGKLSNFMDKSDLRYPM
jgi:hypothetical protein